VSAYKAYTSIRAFAFKPQAGFTALTRNKPGRSFRRRSEDTLNQGMLLTSRDMDVP
jgi:hypothetical protein